MHRGIAGLATLVEQGCHTSKSLYRGDLRLGTCTSLLSIILSKQVGNDNSVNSEQGISWNSNESNLLRYA